MSRSRYQDLAGALNPRGFKILLELLSRGRPVVAEVGYQFKNRVAGESKLDGRVIVAASKFFVGTVEKANLVWQ